MPEKAPSLEITMKGLELIGFDKLSFSKALSKNSSKSIIVAGTNGKGSTCATLETLFQASGEVVGLYTSPHLIESTERIRYDSKDISQEHFVKTFETVDAATRKIKLTHFETLTLMAVWYLCSGELVKPVDRLILEVGLGGVWDSTNAIPHGACIITRLGLDHQNILGRRLIDIAANKFGVVSKNSVVVHAPLENSVRQLALKKREETASHWIELENYTFEVTAEYGSEPIYTLVSPWGLAQINLPGSRGAENTMLALTLFANLGFEPRKYLGALKSVIWPGRMELVKSQMLNGKKLYLSGDHNPQGIKSLLSLLPDYERRHLHLLVGVGVDKDVDGILAPFFELKDTSIYLTETPFRGRKIHDGDSVGGGKGYGPWLERSANHDSSPEKALSKMLGAMKAGDMAIVTGSLYLVGHVKKLMM
jgi:dihydrofolate synthase/folylpolyglutamate synthase